MSETLDFVVRHGYSVLFGWMAAEQLGLPIPEIPRDREIVLYCT